MAHWQQYAVEPPSSEIVEVLKQEQTVPDAVNSLVQALGGLNRAFARLAPSLGMEAPETANAGAHE
jgi:outer membrane protein TolC